MLGRTNAMNRGKSEGLYVWKKSEIGTQAVFVANPTMRVKKRTENALTVSETSFNCKQIENYIVFFTGFTCAEDRTFTQQNGHLYYGTYYKITSMEVLDDTSCVLYIENGDLSKWTTYDYIFNGTKKVKKATPGTAIEFIISDNPNQFPANDEQDGYYYQLIGSISSTNAMSLSDNALAVVQQDYRNQIITEVNT